MATARRKTRAAGRSQDDAIEILQADHRQVEKMFKEFDQLQRSDSDDESKREVVERACAALTVHTQVEEEIFYPAVRGSLRDAELGEEALVEHATAKELIAKLEGLEPWQPFYDATFTVLTEYIKHHVKEEESEMFPQIRKAKLDLEGLGAQMRQRKDELEDENGPGAAGDEDERGGRGAVRSSPDSKPSRGSAE